MQYLSSFSAFKPQIPARRSFFLLFLALYLIGPVLGCTDAPNEPVPTQTKNQEKKGCHPLSIDHEKSCLFPFPSSYYTLPDQTTETGFRVNLPPRLPSAKRGKNLIPIQPELFNIRDGFSPSSPILVYFKKRIDPDTLIGSSDIAKSIQPNSPVQLIEFGRHTRIPVLAEIDSNTQNQEPQTLIIRPMQKLKPNTRYAVVLLKSIRSVNGTPLQSPKLFQEWMSRNQTNHGIHQNFFTSLKQTLQEIKQAKCPEKELLLFWDFRTGSDTQIFKRILKLKNEVLGLIGEKGPEYTIKESNTFSVEEDPNILRIIKGQMRVPTYLDRKGSNAQMTYDENKKPILHGFGEFDFEINIPQCVRKKQKPIPILFYGHTLFSDFKKSRLPMNRHLLNHLCMIEIGHRWLGFTNKDITFFSTRMQDVNQIIHSVEQVIQSQLNALAMVRMAKYGLPNDPSLQFEGQHLADGKEMYYLGISNGAIMGGVFMAPTKEIKRATFHVGGSTWSLLLSRSFYGGLLNSLTRMAYTNAADAQLIQALLQSLFDEIDPINYAPYTRSNSEKLGSIDKFILMQEGLGDADVPNLATRMWARELNLPGLFPLFEPVFGIDSEDGPLSESGYVQYGPFYEPIPKDENRAAKQNQTHSSVRQSPSAIRQVAEFLRPQGTILQTCEGICDPE